MQKDSVESFLYEKVGYKAIENLLRKKRLYPALLRDNFEGTLFGSWENSSPSKDLPRIPLIKKNGSGLHYPFSLVLKKFLIGYTEEGIDGFFWTLKRN